MSLDYNPTIFISGRHPSKKNGQRILRKGKKPFIAPSLAFTKWEPLAILEAKLKWNQPRIKKCKSISYFFLYADNRVKDGGNAAEGIQDIFQKKELIFCAVTIGKEQVKLPKMVGLLKRVKKPAVL